MASSAVLSLGLFILGPPAQADTSITEIDISSSDSVSGSDLTIALSGPVSLSTAQQTISQLTDGDYNDTVAGSVLSATTPSTVTDVPDATSPRAKISKRTATDGRTVRAVTVPDAYPKPPPTGSNGYANFHCNDNLQRTDSDGTFGAHRTCGESSTSWYWEMAPQLVAICSSLATEDGMEYSIDAVKVNKSSPHVEPCAYLFHGTWHGTNFHDYLWYADFVTFRVQVGGETGTAEVDIHGGLYMLAARS